MGRKFCAKKARVRANVHISMHANTWQESPESRGRRSWSFDSSATESLQIRSLSSSDAATRRYAVQHKFQVITMHHDCKTCATEIFWLVLVYCSRLVKATWRRFFSVAVIGGMFLAANSCSSGLC